MSYDVVIAGGGPVGLFLACELQLAGVSVAVLSEVGQTRGGRLAYVGGRVKDALGLTAVLVRPDGFVAWATESQPDAAAAQAAIEQWFGSPTAGAGSLLR